MRSMFRSIGVLGLLLVTVPLATAAEFELLFDDFESGLDAWTQRIQTYSDFQPKQPERFPESGTGIYGPNTNHNGTFTVGYSSDIYSGDGTNYDYIRRQFPTAVAPGTYTVTLNMDIYLWINEGQTDAYAVGNRPALVIDDLYGNLTWDRDQWQPNPALPNNDIPTDEGTGMDYWPHAPDDTYYGVWTPVSIEGEIVTTTGNLELRLIYHDKSSEFGGPQTVAWDNIVLTLDDDTQTEVFRFEENWEAADSLDQWDRLVWPPLGADQPSWFEVDDPDLYYQPGVTHHPSRAAGYSSNLPHRGDLKAAWLQRHVTVDPGVHTLRLSGDWYLWKDWPGNWWAVGNRVYILTDDLVDDIEWNFDTPTPSDGLETDRWNLWPEGTPNGEWEPFVLEGDVDTTSGTIEVRLLLHNKEADEQAIAWDNVRLSLITPCNDPRFDADNDGDVDHEDFTVYQTCFTDHAPGTLDPEDSVCQCMDSDQDDDVDPIDLTAFEACASGPGVPADIACDDSIAP